MVREDCAALLGAGGVFNPDWLPWIRGIKGVCLMGWMATNTSTLKNAADRLHLCPDRRAMEIMVALANEPDADPWFTVPHLADDALVRDLAQIARGRPETQPARSCRIFQRGLEPAVRSSGLSRCTSHGALESQDAVDLGLTGVQADSHLAAHCFDLAIRPAAQNLRDGSVSGDTTDVLSFLLSALLPYHAAVAAKHGLTLML